MDGEGLHLKDVVKKDIILLDDQIVMFSDVRTTCHTQSGITQGDKYMLN
jgi:hypothetical protein